MKQSTDPRLKILIIFAVILILGGIIFGIAASKDSEGESAGVPQMEVDANKYDFGDVSMAKGTAKHIFSITNKGDGDLKLFDISTSCMCTKAILEIDGKRSPAFGMSGHGTNPRFWSEPLSPGQSANLEVIYDPNAHGPNATGPINRVVTVHSNDGGKRDKKHIFTFTANVVK